MSGVARQFAKDPRGKWDDIVGQSIDGPIPGVVLLFS
jgi:hypothetical protein